MGFSCTRSPLSRCSLITCRYLRYHTKRAVDARLGVAYDGTRVIRMIDGTEINPTVYALRNKLLYCDYLQNSHREFAYPKRIQALKAYISKTRKKEQLCENDKTRQPSASVLLEKLYTKEKAIDESKSNENDREGRVKTNNLSTHRPYAQTHDASQNSVPSSSGDNWSGAYKRYLSQNKTLLHKHGIKFKDYLAGHDDEIPLHWMSDYEQFNDSLMDEAVADLYGTQLPDSEMSNVPCAGCGAVLHCKDHGIPGYLPSEIFMGLNEEDLRSLICQRCHFLKYYNTALNVRVSPVKYSEMLKKLKDEICAVVLIVDMTDIPCSIWPDLNNILHPESKLFVVGNKSDLLPLDGPLSFQDLSHLLRESLLSRTRINIRQIAGIFLTSAKTGFGIEMLINALFRTWNGKGNTYLVGCTNVGKSSLFNCLIHSDYCTASAVDIPQLATVSSWPGTTLNLLKFPVRTIDKNGTGQRMRRLSKDTRELQIEREAKAKLFELRKNIKYATLEGIVAKTATLRDGNDKEQRGGKTTGKENSENNWCYDTPGTVNSDQILDLLTIDELASIKPKHILNPRTFNLRLGETAFVAGLGRIDHISGSRVRCTLFSSQQLPITMCATVYANEIYDKLLKTEAFIVPINEPERLKVWPRLESKQLEVVGIGDRQSAADIVLSSAGWIAITGTANEKFEFNVWTPLGRGIHLRVPAFLSKSVAFKGPKISGTPLFQSGKQMYFIKKITDDP